MAKYLFRQESRHTKYLQLKELFCLHGKIWQCIWPQSKKKCVCLVLTTIKGKLCKKNSVIISSKRAISCDEWNLRVLDGNNLFLRLCANAGASSAT